jgi:tetratricopeptide (TPR) repeat protein
LTDYQQQRLQLSREINHRAFEADALMECGQVQGIYLGDYDAGLALEKEAWQIWQNSPGGAMILVRIVQILTAQGNYDEALAVLEQIQQMHFQELNEIFQIGLFLAAAGLEYAVGDAPHLRQALASVEQAQKLVTGTPRLGQQHKMALATKATAIHLALAKVCTNDTEIKKHHQLALDSSMVALTTFEHFGYAQALECVSEEVFYNHSQALAAAGRKETAATFLQRAFEEMMRKHALIPENSPFRQSFLENIRLHRQIEASYTAQKSGSR